MWAATAPIVNPAAKSIIVFNGSGHLALLLEDFFLLAML